MADPDADWVQRDQEFQYKMAREANEDKNRARLERTERVKGITVGTVIVLVVAAVAALIWRIVVTAQDSDLRRDLEHEKTITACTSSGRSWVSINGGQYTCVKIGESQ